MTSRTFAKLFALTAFAAVIASPFALPVDAQAVTINIVSDSTWTVTDTNGSYLGDTQNVCLNATAPSNCPLGATSYGYTLRGWIADLSSIPGATWIWAPNITGATSPAANAEFTFEKIFYLCGAPRGGKIWVAADNSAEVLLNGKSVLNSTSHSALSMVDILPADLVQGQNIIQVKVKNGLNPSDCGSDQYHCNPAGVVLGASVDDALSALPTCTASGKTYTVGQFETLSCPPGKIGSRTRPCICIGSNGFWGPISDTCTSSPPTCTGDNGGTFNIGQSETFSCPPGQTGSRSHTCELDRNGNAKWGDISDTCTGPPPPPPTCTNDDGVTFAVDAEETILCIPPKVGSQTRKCKPDGTWEITSSTCELPKVGEGDVCGYADERTYVATCPDGTECKPRHYPGRKPPWWCGFVLYIPPACTDHPGRMSTEWFCDP